VTLTVNGLPFRLQTLCLMENKACEESTTRKAVFAGSDQMDSLKFDFPPQLVGTF
jgi:hypothetical protein